MCARSGPVQENSAPARLPIVPPLGDRAGPPLVLVVEDDEPLRDLVVEALRELGCAVEGYADAIPLLHINLEQGAPDLIITDVRLPGTDGLAAIQLLRERGTQVPTFVMTAFPSVEVRNHVHQLGVACLFEKPFDPEDLVDAVRSLLLGPPGGNPP